MNYFLLFLGLFFGILTARVGTIGARGGIEPSNAIVVVINFASMVCTFALIIWGFMNTQWWIPLVTIVVVSVIVGLAVNRENWPSFYKAIPVTGVVTIGVTILAWFQ